jgi:hypothetical protein
MSVRVVIVNWNAGELLTNCLRSIARYGVGVGVDEVVVVDNGSTDRSDQVDVPGLPLQIIRTGRNLGFAAACNIGAQGATTPFLLFLNPDAELRSGTLPTALAHMIQLQSQKVGVCGVRLEDRDGHVQHHTTNLPTARSIFNVDLFKTRFDHLSTRRVGHVIGAFYLIRRPLFEQLGGFDERYFVYLEDLDLSLRVQRAGWGVEYLAEAAAYHLGGGTSEQVKAHRLFYSTRSRLIYAFKHFPGISPWSVAAVSLVAEPMLRLARAASRKSGREFADTLRAYWWLWRDLPRIARLAHSARRETGAVSTDRGADRKVAP